MSKAHSKDRAGRINVKQSEKGCGIYCKIFIYKPSTFVRFEAVDYLEIEQYADPPLVAISIYWPNINGCDVNNR